MTNYIDGFVLPIPSIHLKACKKIAEQVNDIWKEYGAIAYFEYVGDDLTLEGTKSFTDTIGASKGKSLYLVGLFSLQKGTRFS
ncbi:DUF1428 family protein [Hanstruepera marina]|uniref:DUF1428 family protein n=1 Tax=Hanstruepera marina TaxID=2873265 RepID=UPI001CA65393|nr:DUF1428 family protein [Hanstruepera marina]